MGDEKGKVQDNSVEIQSYTFAVDQYGDLNVLLNEIANSELSEKLLPVIEMFIADTQSFFENGGLITASGNILLTMDSLEPLLTDEGKERINSGEMFIDSRIKGLKLDKVLKPDITELKLNTKASIIPPNLVSRLRINTFVQSTDKRAMLPINAYTNAVLFTTLADDQIWFKRPRVDSEEIMWKRKQAIITTLIDKLDENLEKRLKVAGLQPNYFDDRVKFVRQIIMYVIRVNIEKGFDNPALQ